MMKDNKPLILPFSDICSTDLSIVGGKGANLGELTHAGFPIPSGFCVTTVAFEQFIAACAEADNLYTQLGTVNAADLEAVRRVGQHVRETLLTVQMPPPIAAAVRKEWQRVGVDEAYAVRSSATAEDLPDASFAGQQDTYLNIIGEDALFDAVRRCWVSLFTDRAILYRVQNNFPHQDVQLSVIVQQMVMAGTSGILFTADPLTGHRHSATIDAGFGLGEALVSGTVSPDSYRVDKRDLTIIDRQIADKQIAVYPEKDGGVRQETLPAAQRAQMVLTDAQIVELVRMGTQVEGHYDTPQDIEWAMVGEQLYLLQARPITSLYPIDGLQSPDDSLHIYFSMGHQQMMTNVMSPLGMSTMLVTVPLGHTDGVMESTLARVSGGRLFIDITLPLRHPILRKLVLKGSSQFDALMPQALQLAMQRPEFQHPHRLSIPFKMVGGMLVRVLYALWWQDLTSIADCANAVLAQDVDAKRAKLNGIPRGEAQVRATVETLPTLIHAALYWIPKLIAGEIAKRLIERLMGNRADPPDLDAFTLGVPGNVVTEMNLLLGDLADAARQSPQLTALFAELENDSAAWLAEASKINDSAPFFQAWDAFLTDYGARGPSEIDIQAPRWYEEPLPLLKVIASTLQKEAGSHRKQHQKLAAAREAAVERLMTQAKRGLFGWPRGLLLRRLIHVAHQGGVLREHHKFLIVQHFRTVKEIIKKIAVQLTDAKKLTQSDDIWFLRWPDLLALYTNNKSNAFDLVAQRRADFVQFQKITPPVIITSDGETPVVKYHVADAPHGALVGNPVSPGVVDGIVHVIHDPQTEMLNPGDILVAPFTDPGWTPLFINAGGLITEVGGAMTHGSVVAREYGIPAIVGVSNATKALQTGQRVRVDGNRGVIEILQ